MDKSEFELLRGESIRVLTGNPMEIPCIETSDAEKLCKHPVVSVHMITYNHEPYIRQAIESVMMQKADFEFELVIGEDCSQDKTREICFEYQKKYPDKIRVLWWRENLHKVHHPAGANDARTTAHCRGEFIAYCEGDDYWVDPCKLQKQVDIMRAHPNVGLCFGMMQIHYQDTGRILIDNDLKKKWPEGIVPGREMACSNYVIPTATVLVRKSSLDEACKKYELLSWQFRMGDFQRWKTLSLISDVYCHYDLVSAYRQIRASAMHTNATHIYLDSGIVMYYLSKVSNVFPASYEADALKRIGFHRMSIIAHTKEYVARKALLESFDKLLVRYPALESGIGMIPRLLAVCGRGKLYNWYTRNRRRVLGRLQTLISHFKFLKGK